MNWKSKASHSQIINDTHIQEFLKGCKFPKKPDPEEVETNEIVRAIDRVDLGVKHILTVDGSYTTVNVKKNFPSSQIAFFQFGAILFTTDDLQNLSELPFISPEDMKKLHNLQRVKLAIPIKNVVSNNSSSLNESIRRSVYEFFVREPAESSSLMETLCWLVFDEYSTKSVEEYELGSNPNLRSSGRSVVLRRSEMKSDYTFDSDFGNIYLTDVFRLHEVIDEEFGASGILGYVSRLVEQLILFHYIRVIYQTKSGALDDFVFISNGPLSFSGQTANMHKVARRFASFLSDERNLNLLGIEKNGPFVEHALAICKQEKSDFYLERNHFLILSNHYIYNYIKPGDPERMHYGDTSYYSGKVIVHTDDGQIFVITIPVDHPDVIKNPRVEDYRNLQIIINVMKLLKCDMYEDSIIPVAMADKLISLTNHPSKSILESFAKDFM